MAKNIEIRPPKRKIETDFNHRTILSSSSILNGRRKEQIIELKVDQLIPYKNQVRKDFNGIDELAESIKENGVINPLIVSRSEEDNELFEVLSGERRLRASIKAGLLKIPVRIIENKSSEKMELIALIDNIQREDLSLIDRGVAFKQFIEKGFCKSSREVAQKLNIGKTQVADAIRAAEIPLEIIELINKHDIKGTKEIIKISQLTSQEKQKSLIQSIIKNKNIQKIEKKEKIILPKNIVLFKENKFFFKQQSIKHLSLEQSLELVECLNSLKEFVYENNLRSAPLN